MALFRNILLREKIQIVHGHQSSSSLAHESILYARTMGYRVCFTDHSLFGFADPASIHINKLVQITFSDVDHVICVSNTCRENFVLRASLHPAHVSMIPNAVDATKFTPDPSRRFPKETINIVMLSRLVYRKGIDLLVQVIPHICIKFPLAHFIIGGDGPKKLLLEEMRERNLLHDRVELLGEVPHYRVRDVLVRGHIFLNCSLTESFCMALLEAASCGLMVVSTKVGGVPEVLPSSMIKFAEPNPDALAEALADAILISRRTVPIETHTRVQSMYSWMEVAKRTEVVYKNMLTSKVPTLGTRLLRYLSAGPWAGLLACFIMSLMYLYWKLVCYIYPADLVEECPHILLNNRIAGNNSVNLLVRQNSNKSKENI
jgi:phosphatidylinositol N-acetylglucosaminyltransferase subunit A